MAALNLIEIGERIRERRRHLGYTQEQMAEWMNVSIQMISNLERGNKAIRIDNLVKIGSLLGVSTDYILTGHTSVGDVATLSHKLAQLSKEDYKMIELIVDYRLHNPYK